MTKYEWITAANLQPELIKLFKEKLNLDDRATRNHTRFRLVMSLQDWAVSKMKSGRCDDALLHLQETESMPYEIKVDDQNVTQLLLDGVKRKNIRLRNEAKEAKENNLEKKKLEL